MDFKYYLVFNVVSSLEKSSIKTIWKLSYFCKTKLCIAFLYRLFYIIMTQNSHTNWFLLFNVCIFANLIFLLHSKLVNFIERVIWREKY
jgi:hypothetical protein